MESKVRHFDGNEDVRVFLEKVSLHSALKQGRIQGVAIVARKTVGFSDQCFVQLVFQFS